MSELLLELFSEEIPARMQENAGKYLEKTLKDSLKDNGIDISESRYYVTPRRLCVVMTGLSLESQTVQTERKGPRVDAPQQAIDGFLKSTQLSLSQLQVQSTPKGDFYFAYETIQGKQTQTILSDIIPHIIQNFHWPKSMRWGDASLRWVRPLHHILCLFSGKIVEFSVGQIASSNITFGHRFMAPEKIEVHCFDDYQSKLEKAFVILDQNKRKDSILMQTKSKLSEIGVDLIPDNQLLDEVTGLVEYPVALVGVIEEKFQTLPKELLSVTMKTHQKYFSGLNPTTQKISHYVTISNIITPDNGATILRGNQRVLAARLSDAKFFYEQDSKHKLDENIHKLDKVTYHAQLGSVRDRITRIEKIAEFIAPLVEADKHHVRQAAHLCKADLVSGVVSEFPELQGIMGRYYALASGEASDVAIAIEHHYKPTGAFDTVPHNKVAIAVAIAEKLEQLCGFWKINEKPTGSKDPYALRRCALGILRTIVDNELSINLLEMISHSEKLFDFVNTHSIASDLLCFFHDRLKVYMKESDIRHDIVDAVMCGDNIFQIVHNGKVLNRFVATEVGSAVIGGYKRATNILRHEEKKDNVSFGANINIDRLETEYDKNLYSALQSFSQEADFENNLHQLSRLLPFIESFFEHVIVNDSNLDIREQRLNLLGKLRILFERFCDFSKIESK